MASPEFKVSPEQLRALELEREQLAHELEAAQQKQEFLAQALREKETLQTAPIAPVNVNIEIPRAYTPTPSYNTARVHAPQAKRGFANRHHRGPRHRSQGRAR